MRTHARRTLAAATTLALAAGLTAAVTGPATAATTGTAGATATDEVVIPNPGRQIPRLDTLKHTSASGYAHDLEGTGTVWTDFATGTDTPIDASRAAGHSGLYATISTEPFDQPRTVTIQALGSDARKTVTIPGGQVWSRTYNTDTTLAYTQDSTGLLTSITLYRAAEDGTTIAQPVADIPKALGPVLAVKQDLRGAVLRMRPTADGPIAAYLLDYATATMKPLPAAINSITWVALGDRQIVAYPGNGKPLVSVPRDNPTATPVETVLPAPVGNEGSGVYLTVTGDTVVYQRNLLYPDGERLAGNTLRAIPVGGNTATELLKYAQQNSFAIGPDGSVLVPGGTGALDWAVHRISVGADGTPRTTRVREIPRMPREITHLALGGGRLSYLSPTGRDTVVDLLDSDITTDETGTTTAGPSQRRFAFIRTDPSGLASQGDGSSVVSQGATLYSPTSLHSYRGFSLPAESTVVDASGRYVLARSGSTTYAGDLENFHADEPSVLLTLQNSAAALWDTKVWKPAATAGQVNSYDLKTRTTSPAVDVRSGCRPTELQAVGRWLYWACGAAKAGVYDHTLKKSVPVPVGEALLGDGFVVRHEGDKLRLTDAATGQTSDFAGLPASASGSGRGTTWTVDRFGGDVAYLDAAQDFRLKPVSQARQPLARLDSSVPDMSFLDLSGAEPTATWSPVWRFSKPVGSWTLRVAKGDGEVVRTFTGTRSTGSAVRVEWDGKDSRGRGIEDGQYRWELTARPLDGVGSAQAFWGAFNVWGSSLTTVPGTYTPVPPARLLNTIGGIGAPKAKLGPDGTVRLKVAGQAGVPAEGLTAVVLNVTATNPTATSYVSVYPYGTRRTATSNLNFTAGKTIANLVTVPVVNGWVEFYNHSGSVDLLADIAGYYTEGTAGSAYHPVTPQRILNTIGGVGAPKAKVGAGGTVNLAITEPGVTAVAMNVTATNPTKSSYVSVYPYGTVRPPVSNLNFTAGQSVPNLVIVPVKDGKVTLYNHAGTVDLLADVTGYFKGGAGSVFTGMQPKRIMNTIAGVGVPKAKVGAGQTVTLEVGTKYSAVVLNVTVTNPTSAGYVSVYPYGTARPLVSNLNFTAGQSVPNLVIVPVEDGKVTFYNHSGTVDLLADIAGYYTA
ncbi:FlgD immunoglobulin-like domain containing protein [Streptomyces sp. NPDC003943]